MLWNYATPVLLDYAVLQRKIILLLYKVMTNSEKSSSVLKNKSPMP